MAASHSHSYASAAQNKLKDEGQLIQEGRITDQEIVMDYYKKQATIKTLRGQYAIREKHAKEVASEIKTKDDVEEAVEWLKFHKEKDWNEAVKKQERIEAGEKVCSPHDQPFAPHSPKTCHPQVVVAVVPKFRSIRHCFPCTGPGRQGSQHGG